MTDITVALLGSRARWSWIDRAAGGVMVLLGLKLLSGVRAS